MQIPLCDIRRGLKRRALNEASITALMDSMTAAGQISPIVVKEASIMRERLESGYLLIAGNHRLTAAERLGWDTIEAEVWPADTNAVHLELIEVDENLCRAELTAAEKARAIKLRKILWESLREQEIGGNLVSTYRSDGVKAGPQHQPGFAASTAAITGMSKQAINQYLRINDLPDEVLEAVQGTEADTKAQLLKLANASEEERGILLEGVVKTAMVKQVLEKSEHQPTLAKKKTDEHDYMKDAKTIIRLFNRLPEKNKQSLRPVLYPT